jgi:Leucine-rich repeat (LRR) protein
MNKLTGTIPTKRGFLTTLEILDVSFNDFNRTIPAELGNLTNVDLLLLGSNNLEGRIPDMKYFVDLRDMISFD